MTLLGIPGRARARAGRLGAGLAALRDLRLAGRQDQAQPVRRRSCCARRARARSGPRPRPPTGGDLAQAARPIFYQGRPSWVVVFSEPLDDVRDNVDLIQRQILIAGAIALLVAMASGYYAASVISRRIKRLERAAGEVAAGNFSEPDPGRLRGRARAAGAGLQRDAAQARAARHGAQGVHRQRLARAAHADLLAGRLRRAAQDEDLDEETRDGVPDHHARAGAAACRS